jgi:hypothetical protein
MCKGTHPASFLFVKKTQRIEVFDFASKLDGKALGIKAADMIGTAFAIHQGAPG